MNRPAPRSIDQYLEQLRDALKGVPPSREDLEARRPAGPSVAVPISPKPEPA